MLIVRMEYKDALKQGLYDFEAARNWYRNVSSTDNGGPGMHADLVFAWIRTNALLIAPFTPHFSEHIWRDILNETSSVQTAPFPVPSGPVDTGRLAKLEYMRGVVDSMRSAEAILSRKKAKGKAVVSSYDPAKPKCARLFVASEYPEWQNRCVEFVRSAWDGKTVDDAKLRSQLQESGLIKDKRMMPYCQTFKVSAYQRAADSQKSLQTIGEAAFERSLPFSELDALVSLLPYIKVSLRLDEASAISVSDALETIERDGETDGWSKDRVESGEPGMPAVQFWNTS
jgi:leucyl-tRNA synthetase